MLSPRELMMVLVGRARRHCHTQVDKDNRCNGVILRAVSTRAIQTRTCMCIISTGSIWSTWSKRARSELNDMINEQAR